MITNSSEFEVLIVFLQEKRRRKNGVNDWRTWGI